MPRPPALCAALWPPSCRSWGLWAVANSDQLPTVHICSVPASMVMPREGLGPGPAGWHLWHLCPRNSVSLVLCPWTLRGNAQGLGAQAGRRRSSRSLSRPLGRVCRLAVAASVYPWSINLAAPCPGQVVFERSNTSASEMSYGISAGLRSILPQPPDPPQRLALSLAPVFVFPAPPGHGWPQGTHWRPIIGAGCEGCCGGGGQAHLHTHQALCLRPGREDE